MDNKSTATQHITNITYAVILIFLAINFEYFFGMLKNSFKILTPFIYGLAFAFMLNILLNIFEKKLVFKKRKRLIAIILIYTFVFGVISIIMIFILPQLNQSIASLTTIMPQYVLSMQYSIIGIAEALNIPSEFYNKFVIEWSTILNKAGELTSVSLPYIFDFTKILTLGIINIFLAIVLSFYMLYNKEKLSHQIKKLLYAFLPKHFCHKTIEIGNIASKTFGNFITAQLIEALIIGVLCYIGMLIFKMPYALLISVIIALSNIIPIFGAFIGIIPSAFIILIINPKTALWFVIFIIALQQLEANVIYPRVMGNSIGLSSIWVLFAIIVGGSLFGFIGILLGIPAFAVLYSILSNVVNKRLKKRNLTNL